MQLWKSELESDKEGQDGWGISKYSHRENRVTGPSRSNRLENHLDIRLDWMGGRAPTLDPRFCYVGEIRDSRKERDL